MKIKPVGDNIYIKLDKFKDEIKTESGVIITLPNKHSERTRRATVIDVGDEVKNYKKNDRVLIHYLMGSTLHLTGVFGEDERHRVIIESEILARIEDE